MHVLVYPMPTPSKSDDAPTSTLSVDRIRDHVVPILRPYVTRISIFGSIARGDETQESDLDLLVTLRPPEDRPALGLRWFEIENELTDRLGRPVEIVTENAMSPHVRRYVAPDCVLLYEDK